jgi:hypothetical protein
MIEDHEIDNKTDNNEPYRIVHYSVDENNNYQSGLKSNWGAKEIINTQTWDRVKERISDARQKVVDGKLSPLAYQMEKHIMDVALLAKFVGYCKFRVRRHMKPHIYKKLKPEVLQKYADAFEIRLDELNNID